MPVYNLASLSLSCKKPGDCLVLIAIPLDLHRLSADQRRSGVGGSSSVRESALGESAFANSLLSTISRMIGDAGSSSAVPTQKQLGGIRYRYDFKSGAGKPTCQKLGFLALGPKESMAKS